MRTGIKSTGKRRKENTMILGLIFAIIGGIVFFTWGLPPVQYADTSKNWPSVTGEITRSEVFTYRKEGRTQYLPDIVYKYRVAGKPYTSSRIIIGDPPYRSNISPAKRLLTEYPLGKRVEVFYDPVVPSSAALKPGVRKNDLFLLMITGLLPILGIMLFIRGFKVRQERQEVITLRVFTEN